MNRVQKIAWFNLIVIGVSCILSGITIAVLTSIVGMPRAFGGMGFMGICGIMGFSNWIFRKDKGQVILDERDKLINKRAALAGFGASYLFVGLVCMLPFFILGPRASMQVHWLPMIFMGAGLSLVLAHSAALLIQYGRTAKGV